MSKLTDLVDKIKMEGYSEANAEAKLCQDIVLEAISKSGLDKNITVKGGVVMRSLSGNVRRATQDMDLDFIRYSLADASIDRFIQRINCLDGISIERIGEIEELRQQDYHGKRIHVAISDTEGNSFVSKIDLGVHKNLNIEQEEFCFDLSCDDDGALLLINSKEQMFTEKLRALLKFGMFSTRYKDVFDLCYLIDLINRDRLLICMNAYIFSDTGMRENNVADVIGRVDRTFKSRQYRKNIASANKNWLNMDIDQVFDKILVYLKSL
jgi:predicted nucleotidyltransferase component of viral defense system